MPEHTPDSARLDRAIWRLALPAFGALVAQPAMVLIDAIIVGTLGTASLAGLGAASTVFTTVVGLCIFLAYATTAAVARLWGAGDLRGALGQGIDGIVVGLILGTVIGAACFLGAEPLVRALGTSPQAAADAVTYLRIIALSFPAVLGVLAAVGVLRGLQDTRTTLVVTLLQVGINLVITATLVLVLNRGIAGAAIGTAVAEVLGLLVYAALLARRARAVGARPHLAGLLVSARDGVPLFWRTLALRAVFLLAAAVAARAGDDTLAAWHVTLTVFFTLALALDALAIAGQALLGATLGSGDVAGSRFVTRRLVVLSVLLGGGLAVVVLASIPVLPAWFTSDPAVAALIGSGLVVIALTQPLAGAVFAWDGVLIGAGDTRWLAWAQIVVLLAFLPALWLVQASGAGLVGLWWALAWFMLVRAGILGWRAHGTAWLVTGPRR